MIETGIKHNIKNSSTQQIVCCDECDTLVSFSPLEENQTAYCPNCDNSLNTGSYWNLKRCAFLALSILILMPFAFSFPLIKINLLGTTVNSSVWGGIWKMATEGYPYTAFLILFCAIVMPITFNLLILILQIAKLLRIKPRVTLIAFGYIQPWVMLDVYLVSIGVAAFKVREYAELSLTIYLLPFIVITLLMILLSIKLNPQKFWQEFYPAAQFPNEPQQGVEAVLCKSCHFTFYPAINLDKHQHIHKICCPRCETAISTSEDPALQRVWSLLITGLIMLIPANVLPISVVYLNGVPTADTLMSGVISFLNMGSYAIAAIVFIASIFIPISKIIIMLYLLVCIHFKIKQPIHLQMKLLHIVHFVGRWSMLDLFVLALMMSLVTRGQIINFSVGPAAIYFGLSVFLTMLAASQFDSRLLWKIYDNTTKDKS